MKLHGGTALIEHAIRLADLFCMVSEIKVVALTGSLARAKDMHKANDIDLVLLHDGSLEDCSFYVVRGEVYDSPYAPSCWKLNSEGKSALERILGARSRVIQRYIRQKISCKIDIICANQAVLTDCQALANFSATCSDPEFSNRVFCEIPLLEYQPSEGRFMYPLMHKIGTCCKPKISWETVQKLRKCGLEKP